MRGIVCVVLFLCFAPGLLAQEAQPETSPASIAIVVDCSGSLRLQLDKTVSLIKQIAESMRPGDEAFIVRFVGADKITVTQDFTQAKAEIADAADDLYIEGGQTAIADAVKFTAKHFGESTAKNPARTIILISDGEVSKNSTAIDQVLPLLESEKIRVFAIGMSDLTVNGKFLDKFTKETGGKTFVPRSSSDLSNAVVAIMKSLRGEPTGK